MPTSTHDLTTSELSAITQRLHRAFHERAIWTYVGLQYRLGEVGRNRIEPRQLRRALAELSNNRRPRRGKVGAPGPWEPIPGIFASPEITLEEAYDAANSVWDDAVRLGGINCEEILDRLRAVVETATGTFVVAQDEEVTKDQSDDAPSADTTTFSRTLDLICPGREISMWLTHEAEWLHPNDSHLWAFLSRCLNRGTRPLIVARHIHGATFAMFRRLGVRGVQYYSMLVSEEDHIELAAVAKEVGWTHVRAVEELAGHPAIDRIHASAKHLHSSPTTPEAQSAIRAAIDLGLARESTSEGLLAWARQTRMIAGPKWEEALLRWSAWSAYRTPRRPGFPAGGVQEILKRSEAQAPERRIFGRETTITRFPPRLY